MLVVLITGGVKSGKSRRALDIALSWGRQVWFVATACALDGEMRARIVKHREERAAFGWETVEEPLELHRAVEGAGDALVVDCMPMWVNNLVYYRREADFEAILDAFLRALAAKPHAVVVTNETGLGLIPADELSRRYNLLLAEANRKIAALSGALEFMVCGIPLKVK